MHHHIPSGISKEYAMSTRIEDLFKTVIYTGVGIAATATEKLQKTVDELVEKGKMPADEGKKVVEEFKKNSDERREEYEDRFKTSVKALVDRFDFPTKKDYEALTKRVEKLEKAARAAKSAKSTRPAAKKATPVKATVAKASPKTETVKPDSTKTVK
jgi:polyhydroxyalkanoate synthesis regulator phasin